MKSLIGMFAGSLATLSTPGFAAPVARYDYVNYRALETAPAPPAGSYRNPILPGFQPDPSIVKVDEDLYLVTSTFSWYPGLPIYHSIDLVNWRLIGHAINRAGQVNFSGLGANRGLFAPAISYHDGKFWIVNTCIECGGNFVITAERPEGPWSDPVWLDFGGIDPSLVFGEDGRAWVVYNDAPPGKPLYEGHRAIWLQGFDLVAKRMLPDRTLLINGGLNLADEPVWAEGPHIYRADGWYYLMAAEGGTADRHSETIYRSRKVQGPYEAGPINPILTQRDLPANRADRVEATGHADLVRLEDGSWWGVFLATRPFAGQSTLLGRETFLLPVRWQDGWPRFLDPGEAVPDLVEKPSLPPSAPSTFGDWREEFDAPLSGEWIGLRTPGATQQIVLDRKSGELALVAGTEGAGSRRKPAFIGRRLRHHDAEYVTRLEFAPSRDGDFAGLLAFMDEEHFLVLGIERGALVVRRRAGKPDPERGNIVGRVDWSAKAPVELRLQFFGGRADAAYRRIGSTAWLPVANGIDVEPLASVHAGLFTGLVVGPYAVAGSE